MAPSLVVVIRQGSTAKAATNGVNLDYKMSPGSVFGRRLSSRLKVAKTPPDGTIEHKLGAPSEHIKNVE
jgi:hypothetical protein